MDKPSKDGALPGLLVRPGPAGSTSHYSSGPPNHFFYLLSEGSGAKTINGVTYNCPDLRRLDRSPASAATRSPRSGTAAGHQAHLAQ